MTIGMGLGEIVEINQGLLPAETDNPSLSSWIERLDLYRNHLVAFNCCIYSYKSPIERTRDNF